MTDKQLLVMWAVILPLSLAVAALIVLVVWALSLLV